MPTWKVTEETCRQKLLVFLVDQLGETYSSRAVKKLIESNRCKINKRPEKFASTLLGQGDVVELDLVLRKAASVASFDVQRILYEDEALLFYNKPAFINCDEKGIQAYAKLYHSALELVHRLDRETTGVLVFAKSKSVLEAMKKLFKELAVKKTYLAIVDGAVKEKKGVIEKRLAKKKEYAGQSLWGVVNDLKALYACTPWELITAGSKESLLVCYPTTGRTHQIRVHLASVGHPILGDFQYGKRFQSIYSSPRILLHAKRIQFAHPLSAALLDISAPIPEDFHEAKRTLFAGKK